MPDRRTDLLDAALEPLADFTLGTPWPMNTVVAGVRLVATDTDWSYGTGPEVRASAEALVLVLYGRAPRLDELSGDGAPLLQARL